jgi:hypothetical protein
MTPKNFHRAYAARTYAGWIPPTVVFGGSGGGAYGVGAELFGGATTGANRW